MRQGVKKKKKLESIFISFRFPILRFKTVVKVRHCKINTDRDTLGELFVQNWWNLKRNHADMTTVKINRGRKYEDYRKLTFFPKSLLQYIFLVIFCIAQFKKVIKLSSSCHY